MHLAWRRCLVCDEEVDVLEPEVADEIGLPCTSCGAPTERVAVLRAGLRSKSSAAVALGRRGGLKGGRARADALSPQRRREIARRAAQARWARPGAPRPLTVAPWPHREGPGAMRVAPAGTISPEPLVRRYYRLFNERRLDEAEQLVDPQASFYYVPTKLRFIGRAGYRELASAWLAAFPDARIGVTSLRRVDPETVCLEFKGRGTHAGDLVLGDALRLSATGRAASLVFQNTLRVRHGRIVRVRFDFDLHELRRRLSG
jgi:predicted ester cyclase